MLLTTISPRFLFCEPIKINTLAVKHTAVKNPVKYCFITDSFNYPNLHIIPQTKNPKNVGFV
jgi:hypothetical protein